MAAKLSRKFKGSPKHVIVIEPNEVSRSKGSLIVQGQGHKIVFTPSVAFFANENFSARSSTEMKLIRGD